MKKLGVILLLIATLPGYGQDQTEVDSLLTLLRENPIDTVKIKIYGKLSWLYASTREKTEIARQYADSIRMIGERLEDDQSLVYAEFYYGVINRYEGNYEEALEHLNKFVQFHIKKGDTHSEATGLYQIGTIQENLGNYDQSLAAYQRVKTIHENNKFWFGVGFTLNGMGNIYRRMDRMDEALKSYQRALSIFDSLHLPEDQAYVLENMGITYEAMQDYQKALHYFNQALAIDRNHDVRYGIASDLEKIGLVYNKLSDHTQALNNLMEALEIRESLPQKNELADTKNHVGYTYLRLKDYDQAEQYLQEGLALAQQIKAKPTIHTAYTYLTELYEAKNDFRQAYEYNKLSSALKDSMLNEEKIRQLNELHTKYQTEQKEAQITQQQSKIQQQRTQNRLILLGVAVFLLLILLGYQRMQQKQKFRLLEARKIKELDRIKSNFFANISHEFRTPLTLILGSLTKLRKNKTLTAEQQEKEFGIMQNNSQRLLQLINQLLELSRLDAGKARLQASRIDIVPFLKRIALSFASFAEQKGIRLLFHGSPVDSPGNSPGIYLYLDKEKMEKVFYNLLSNAVKFTPDGGEIQLDLALSETGEQIEISVRNSGPGITADQLPFIFDRFYQADSHSTRKYEGTGIGLSLVKELVELHRGSIRVQSIEQEQTTFTLTLKLGKTHLKPDEIVESTEHSEVDEALGSSQSSILEESALATEVADDAFVVLIVEDHRELRQYIRESLPSTYHILEAENGKQGLEAAREHIPDLIISDVMMPEMDGFELLQSIRKNEKTNHIPLILLTARASVEDKLEGLQQGADEYLVKPFHPEELQLRVSNLITIRKELQQKYSQQIRLRPTSVSVPSQQQQFLQKLQQIIDQQMEEETFGVEELCRELGMSRTQLNRKLKAMTDQTPSELIRTFRLERAAELIRQDAGNMAEIAYQTGFSSQSYFTRAFQEAYHCSPMEYKKQHQNILS